MAERRPSEYGWAFAAIAAYEADPSTYWIATASGGLVKTTNNGDTFEHQFDHESTVSIGDVCVAPVEQGRRLGGHWRKQPA